MIKIDFVEPFGVHQKLHTANKINFRRMKKRVLAMLTGLLIATGTLYSQTLTDVINEFNAGVESLNGQSYETALTQFNNCLALCDLVGDEATDMKGQAQQQVVGAHYRQATTLMKRKQYDQAIPFLENTVKFSEEYTKNEEMAVKASKYLPSLYLRQGNILLKQEDLDEAMLTFDKVLKTQPNMYKANQGKGLVYQKLDEVDNMLSEFAIAKEKAVAKGDEKFVADVNGAINGYFKPLIDEEIMMFDPEEADYTYLIDICEQAIEANEKNAFAYYNLISIKNKEVEYDAAVEYALKALAYEDEFNPNLLSGIYFELGKAYQNSIMYEEACEAYNKVTEEPFFTKAENKMMTANCQ